MPIEFVLDASPAGYSTANASGIEGNPILIAVREFTSSEDGDLFISRLEGIPSQLIAKVPPERGVRPSIVDHMLAVIRPDLHTTLYVNECRIAMGVRFGRRIEAGEPVYNKDIVDINSLMFDGIDIPEDAAVVIIISDGWRKGLFFDFTPLGPNAPKREYDLNRLLGSYLAYLKNQALFQLDAPDWDFLIRYNWFPFLTLSANLKSKFVSFAKKRDDLDRLLPEVVSEVKELIPQMLQRWPESAFFEPHLPFVRHAIEEFQDGDFISSTAILYPRIEGLLRTLHVRTGIPEKATQKVLSETAVEQHGLELHQYSWLLPEMFRRYLEEAYFANFQPGQRASLSRNSLGHGVASIEEFNEKGAAIGLLILDQLFYFLPAMPASKAPGPKLETTRP